MRGPIPSVSNSRSFKKGIRCVMNEDITQVIEKKWDGDKPFRLRVVKSDADGVFRAAGYAVIEQAIFRGEIDELLER
jgi:hypothetical protein